MKYSVEVKEKLLSLISEMDMYHWLFTKHPETDFSRVKKWSFEETVKFILFMEGKSLKDELLEYFDFDNHTPSNSSFNMLYPSKKCVTFSSHVAFLYGSFEKAELFIWSVTTIPL